MMKNYLILFFSLCCLIASGQSINKVSVNIFQNGSSIDTQEFTAFTPAGSIDESISLNTSALSPGTYEFTIVVQNDADVSSILSSGAFVIDELITSDADVTEMEYFFDTDPGRGMGTPISVSSGSEISVIESINTNGLAPGFHTVYLRARDSSGHWGHYVAETVFIESSIGFGDVVTIESLEYFIDTDPGAGSGTSIPITPASDVSLMASINLSGQSPGFHTVYLRGKLENGTWGPLQATTVFVESAIGATDVVVIESLEYFIDTDPGPGMATSISVTPSSNISLTESINLSGESPGFHTVYLRGKLENGTWGPFQSTTIFIESSIGLNDAVVIESLEYFVDTDPGVGAGTAISVTPSSNVSLMESINLSAFSSGFHTVYLRGKLQNGEWGPYTSQTVLLENSNQTTPNQITSIEYFIDTDPGVGNGLTLSASLPATSVDEAVNLNTSSLNTGTHEIGMRVQDQSGRWGHYLSKTIQVIGATLVESITNGNWNDIGTWSTGSVPSATDSVVIKHSVLLNTTTSSVLALTVASGGTLDLNGNEIHVSGRFSSESSGTFTANGGFLYMDGGSQIYQHQGDITHGHLIFGGTGTKTLDYQSNNVLFIEDSIHIANGVLMSFTDTPEIVLNSTSDFVNNGTITSTDKWSLLVDGTSHMIDGGDFMNVSFQTSASLTLLGDFNYDGTFDTPGNGSSVGLGNFKINLGDSWTFDSSDALTFSSNGSLEAAKGVSFTMAGTQAPTINVKSLTETFQAQSNLTFANGKSLVIESGIVTLMETSFSGVAGITVTGGQLTVTNNKLVFGNGGSITNNGGTITISGSSAAIEGVDNTSAYSITQNSGVLNFSDLSISELGGAGISLQGGTATLSNLNFSNGLGAAYLTFGAGFDGSTYSGFSFVTGPTFNVEINDGVAETITFDAYSGGFGGPTNDDPGSLGTINWTNEILPDVTAPVIGVDNLSTFDRSPPLSGTVDDALATIVVTISGVNYNSVINNGTAWTLADNTLSPLDVGTYDVMVAATDQASNVGNDATTGELVIQPSVTTANAGTLIQTDGFTTSWNAQEGGVQQYLLDVGLDAAFENFIEEFQNRAVATLSQEVTGLQPNTNYFFRVRVQYSSGSISDYSNVVAVTTNNNSVVEPVDNTSDSLALVAIYNGTSGANWTNSENWLTGSISTWFGVTVSESRVTKLELPGNNLVDSIPNVTSGLEKLSTLNLSGNSLNAIGTLTPLTTLASVDVSNNNLQFASLENVIAVISSATYSPQQDALAPIDTLVQLGATFTFNRTLSGSSNNYQWFKNDQAFDLTGGELAFSDASFADEGTYRVTVTNAKVPGLELSVRPILVKVSSLERDRLVLLSLYETMGGTAWTNGADWPNQSNVSDWQGIALKDGRVSEINLAGANVIGELPASITNLTDLTVIDLSGNNIQGLPDLTSLANLTSLNVSSNQLDFGDLESNVTIAGFDYSDQRMPESMKTVKIPKGEDYTIAFTVGGANNTYRWSVTGPVVNGIIEAASGAEYVIPAIDYNNMGAYTLQVTNSQVPGLTITSAPQNILAVVNLDFDPTYSNINGSEAMLDEGQGYLLQLTSPGSPFDSIQIASLTSTGLSFDSVVLGDYLISIRTQPLFLRNVGGLVDSVKLLPSYFDGTFLWEEADTLQLREQLADLPFFMQRQPRALTPADGDGEVGLLVETDFAGDAGARIEARRKVQRAGCSLRRRRRATGGRAEADDFELVVYKETDDEGRVTFENLPPDTYRLNIEYPGIPMDPNSFVEFEVGEGGVENNTLELAATIDESGIFVELIDVLGFHRKYFKGLSLYPNPAHKQLHIRYEKLLSEGVYLQILNLEGKVLREEKVSSGHNKTMSLNVMDMEEGIYLIRFLDPGASSADITAYRVVVKR